MQLKKSFQILKKNFFKIVVFDILFFISLYLLKIFFLDKIKSYLLNMQPMMENLQTLLIQSDDIANFSGYSSIEVLKPVLDKMYVLLILFFVFLFLCFNIFNSVAWNLSYKGVKEKVKLKVDFNYLGKFFVWNLIIVLLVAGLNYLLNSFVFVVVGFYFAFIGYVKLNEEKLFMGIKQSFIFGIKKIHKVLLNYLIVIGVFIIILVLLVVVRYLIGLFFVSNVVNFVIGIIFLLVFIVWGRIFLSLNFRKV